MMKSGRASVHRITPKYIVLIDKGEQIYASRSLCPNNFGKGERVKYRAMAWDPERVPEYLTNVTYKATMVSRESATECIPTEQAIIIKVQTNGAFLIRYGKDVVYCSQEFSYNDIAVDDIVVFRAESWDDPPTHLQEQHVRYRCTYVALVKKPTYITASGKFNLIDAKGHYGYVDAIMPNGLRCNVFVSSNVVMPFCRDLHLMFDMQSEVRLKAIEQAANRKNSNTRWRAYVVTDEKHIITDDDDVRVDPTYDENKSLAARLSPVPEEPLVYSNPFNLERRPISTSPTPPQSSSTTGSTSSPAHSPSPSTSSGGEGGYIPPAHLVPANTIFVHINREPERAKKSVSQEKRERRAFAEKIVYSKGHAYVPNRGPDASDLVEMNRKLRMLAHYMTNYEDCDFCLTHSHIS